MLDRAILGTSWDSVVSNGGCGVRIEDCSGGGGGGGADGVSTRSSPEPASRTTSEHFCISRHNPNRTFRRENVIASWRSVKREREQALGKRSVQVPCDMYRDYYGRQDICRSRSKVKRCRSERTAAPPATEAEAAVQRKVKRTYSVLYRYDPSEERVVKEYKYLKQHKEEEAECDAAPALLQRARSEPLMPAQAPSNKNKTGKKAKRSLTAFLTFKTRLLNIFTNKS